MRQISIKIKGIAPLIMNQFNSEVPEAKRSKRVYVPEEEAKRRAYYSKDGKLYLPGMQFKASMIRAASDFKMAGKKTYKDYIKSGIFIKEDEVILDQQEYVIHAEPVVIARARVMKWRPKIEEWSCSFTIDVVDEMIDKKVLKEILETAGKYKGVGDHRPEYGRFEVVEFK